ncbi:DNA polymerase III subunit gamma/tau [Helicobacter didelphidarum]|uniref:DNA-directed DNA polymerase n=1 Tax=Helicobacter didelphidarum TaxID=2040648 RepID=A0A3D8IQ16_9HELI|nr:DNA polymerase III subunit gamma/tau [Helicobacter didelphidarum]RDU67080.1 DNA polymerase III subunit gamma/tau [Helicobacter didelphidarum]
MNTNNNPPWDINHQSNNPLDTSMPFIVGQTIFDYHLNTIHKDSQSSKGYNISLDSTQYYDMNPNKQRILAQPQTDIATESVGDITSQIDSNSTLFHNDSTSMQTNNLQLPLLGGITTNSQPHHTFPTNVTNNNINTLKNIDNMLSLALKYRPKTFRELIGQESVARTLCLALDTQKIANGYLFSGLRGGGKTSSARIFARCLQCERGISSMPCGKCVNCIEALKGSHIDIIELDGASNRKIDDIRDLIEQTKYKPTLGRYKVFIIDEVHMLTKEAFNSLLKTLEEPPSYVKFILATTDPLKVPPTILSRTQHFRFKKIPTNALKQHLNMILQKEQVSIDTESLDILIRNGHGSVRDTLTLLDQAIVFCQNHITNKKLADMLGSLDSKIFDTLFQSLLRKDMQACIGFIKNLDGYEVEMILDELSFYIKNKMLQEVPQIPPVLGMRYANIICDSKAMLQLDCDGEFCLLLTILKMFEAQKIKEIETAINQLESIQKNIAPQAQQILQNNQHFIEQDTTDIQKDFQKQENSIPNQQLDAIIEHDSSQSFATKNENNPIGNTNFSQSDTIRTTNINAIESLSQHKDYAHSFSSNHNDNTPSKSNAISLSNKPLNSHTSFESTPNNIGMQTSCEDNNTLIPSSHIESTMQTMDSLNSFKSTTKNEESTQVKNHVTHFTIIDSDNSQITHSSQQQEQKTEHNQTPMQQDSQNINIHNTQPIKEFSNTGGNDTTQLNKAQNQSTSNSLTHTIQSTPTQQNKPRNMQEIFPQNNDSLFQNLIQQIYDRDYRIGEFFEHRVAFQGMQGNNLHLTFYTSEEELVILRQSYNGIISLIRKVFGNQTQLKVTKQTMQDLEKLTRDVIQTTKSQNQNNNDSIMYANHTQNVHHNNSQNTTSNHLESTQYTSQQIPQKIQPTNNYDLATQQENELNKKIQSFIQDNREMLQSANREFGVKTIKVVTLDGNI